MIIKVLVSDISDVFVIVDMRNCELNCEGICAEL